MLQFMKAWRYFTKKIVVSLSAFISLLYALTSAEDEYEIFPAQFNITSLNGQNGFAINGSVLLVDESGTYVSGSGDINGDGIPDILICAIERNNPYYFAVNVVFGSKKSWPASISLDQLNGENGFVINGAQYADHLSAVGAGDVNGDNIDDILIGVPGANNVRGQSYVIFGSKGPWAQSMNLLDLNGQNGFTINGINPSDASGGSISGAGDVNADGIADFLVGAIFANNYAGQSYVVFGRKQWPIAINLADLDGTNGFAINGINLNDYSGTVSGVGDVNVDGIDDILIGAPGANNDRGQSYIVFGSHTTWPSAIDLGLLNGTNGFAISGVNPYDSSGSFVAEVDDVNGDGIDDFLIGSVNYNTINFVNRGLVYLVYGSRMPWPAVFQLANLNGINGFIITGIQPGLVGFPGKGAGDINRDGMDDIIIGVDNMNNNAGQSYVVFGRKGSRAVEINIANLDGSNGFKINGNSGDYSGCSVSGIGDFNDDGIDDILIGAVGANDGRSQSYLIFGQAINDDIKKNEK